MGKKAGREAGRRGRGAGFSSPLLSTRGGMVTTIKLQSSDGHEFEVAEDVANMSETIRNMIEDTGDHMAIPLHNVAAKTLSKVIEYCKHHTDSRAKGPTASPSDAAVPDPKEDEEKQWDLELVKVDNSTLFDLILAANYLNITPLLDLTCEKVAEMIKNKTAEEIRTHFNIKMTSPPEEEEQVRKENEWAFE